jgi:quinol monooxygenase YgiN
MTEVLELRQYTLHPGRRADLIDLFDREFVESQEALGIRLYGQFRDLDDDDRFVWFRGFADMAARAEALGAFYGGPVWREHRDKVNDTMIDSDDVLLLRPSGPSSGFALTERPETEPASLVTVTIYHLPAGAGDEFAAFFDTAVAPVLADTGAAPLARLRTEPAENNFPALPVRADANVFAWVASFADEKQHHDHVQQLGASIQWTRELLPALVKQAARPPEQLHLRPTERSRLH